MTCDVDKKNVINLNLDNHQLDGELTTDIQTFTKLETLNLANNTITGLPDELGKLSYLTDLNLSSNKLTEIPKTLFSDTNLVNLNLSNNSFASIPDTITDL